MVTPDLEDRKVLVGRPMGAYEAKFWGYPLRALTTFNRELPNLAW